LSLVGMVGPARRHGVFSKLAVPSWRENMTASKGQAEGRAR
jgi:hypothetical protein